MRNKEPHSLTVLLSCADYISLRFVVRLMHASFVFYVIGMEIGIG